MTIKRAAASCLLALLMTYNAAAQTDNADTTLHKRVSRLENAVEKLEKAVDKLPKISGVVNLRYQLDHNSYESANSFDIRRARVDFKGDLGSKVNYRLHVEFAGTPKLLDVFVNYAPLKELKVQVGQFKIPFSLENEYGIATLETSENSMAIARLSNFRSDVKGVAKANGRDMGVMLHGGLVHRDGFDIVNYAAGVFNGNGLNITDDNKAKDFSGRLTIKPVRYLSLSGSYYYGSYGKTGTDLQHRHRAAGGLKWETKRWLFRSEYLYSISNDVKTDGAYAVVGYYVVPKLQAVLKYDFYRADRSSTQTIENDYLVGLNYTPFKRLRLQANYTFKSRRGKQHDTNCLALQAYAIF